VTIPSSQSEWRSWLASSSPPLALQIKTWLILAQAAGNKIKEWDRCQLQEGGITVLIRDHTNGVTGQCFVIATVCVEHEARRKGIFKSILNECIQANPWPRLIIEDIENPLLLKFINSIGGKEFNKQYPNTREIYSESIKYFDARPLQPYASYLGASASGASQVSRAK
jgi:hypothetical protein